MKKEHLKENKISRKHVIFFGFFRRRSFNVLRMKQDFVIETDTRRLVWQRAGESDSVRFKLKTLRSTQRSRRLHIVLL